MSLRSRNRRARRLLKKSPKPVDIDELIKEADKWDRRYLDVTIHALERYDGDRCNELVREFLSRRNRGAFHATNPHSKRLWLPELMQEFLALQRQQHGRSWLGPQPQRCGRVVETAYLKRQNKRPEGTPDRVRPRVDFFASDTSR